MVKIKISYVGGFKTECIHKDSNVKISTIPPRDLNPEGGTSFSPTDLLAASLGSCMITLMAIVAKKEGFDLKECTADVEKEMASAPQRKVGRLIVQIRSSQKPSEPIRLKLEKAALECPVYLSLHPDVKKEVGFVWGL